GFAVFQLVVGGAILAALVHGLFAVRIATSIAGAPPENLGAWLVLSLYATSLVLGYGVAATLGTIGLARRGLIRVAWVLALMPIYWLLLSLAAWRALYQLAVAPHHWEKTEHGLARTSRLAE